MTQGRIEERPFPAIESISVFSRHRFNSTMVNKSNASSIVEAHFKTSSQQLTFAHGFRMKDPNAYQSTMTLLVCGMLVIGSVFLPPPYVHSWTHINLTQHHRRKMLSGHRFSSALKSFKGETQNSPWLEDQLAISTSTEARKSRTRSEMMLEEFQSILQLLFGCIGISILLISWEDISMAHPMRMESRVLLSRTSSSHSKSVALPELNWRWGRSTVRGLASGSTERQAIAAAGDLEASSYENLPSYNEVMQTHREDRIPLWNVKENDQVVPTTRNDVVDSVRAIQLALLRILDCEELARNYEWDQLTEILNEKVLRSDLQNACYILKGADEYLSREARDEIGFDWGSCAWRHCGALSDAQEAIDALEHQVGMLEPFECTFCLDVVERSLRDMLAVTNKYADESVKIPEYIPIQRMSDLSNQEDNDLDRQDTEYMDTLSILRNSEF